MLIYLITNRVNGKVYIGKWEGTDVAARWKRHLQDAKKDSQFSIHRAIRKHGEKNFEVRVLETTTSKQELCSLEMGYIKRFGSFDFSVGYNMTAGGEGCRANDEVRARMSEALRGERNPMFGVPSPMKGRHHPPETIAKLSAAKIGAKHPQYGKPLSEAHREKLRQYRLGRRHSEETRRKMSESQQRQRKLG